MFIEIGNGNVVQSSTIIAMIEYDLIASSVLLQEMVTRAKQEKKLKGPKVHMKSVLVTTEAIYYSTLSVATLKKRTSIKTALKNQENYTDEESI